MSLATKKQILANLATRIKITGFTASGTSGNITTPLTTALSTASDSGSSVPLQVSTNKGEGVITVAPYNKVEIWANATKDKLSDANNNEVYGRITQASGVYTISYYTLVSGTETAYSITSTSIDFDIAYVFKFKDLPYTALLGIQSLNIQDDIRPNYPVFKDETLTVTATNTVSNISSVPRNGNAIKLIVNDTTTLQQNTHFTITGQAISFSAGQLIAIGFDIETTDTVRVNYFV